MITAKNVKEAKIDNRKTKFMAEFIASVLENKIVEIYLGNSYEELNFDQFKQDYPSVLVGKVVSAYGNCLVLETVYINGSNKESIGKLLFINDISIHAVSEVVGDSSLEDVMFRSRETKKLLGKFNGK